MRRTKERLKELEKRIQVLEDLVGKQYDIQRTRQEAIKQKVNAMFTPGLQTVLGFLQNDKEKERT